MVFEDASGAGSSSGSSPYVLPDLLLLVHKSDEKEVFYTKEKTYGLDQTAPILALEVTSPSTRKRDLEKKTKVYASRNIKNYVIVDRKEEIVIVHKSPDQQERQERQERKYNSNRTYKKDQIVGAFPFDEMRITAQELVIPTASIDDIFDSPVKKEQARHKKTAAALSAEKKERARERAQHQKERAHDKAQHQKERAHDKAQHKKERAHDKAQMEAMRAEMEAMRAQLDTLNLKTQGSNEKGSGTSPKRKS